MAKCKTCENNAEEYIEKEIGICGECVATAATTPFWISPNPNVTMHCDGKQFVAQVDITTLLSQTYFSVGYYHGDWDDWAWPTEPQKDLIRKALEDAQYKNTDGINTIDDLEKLVPELLRLCKVATETYNSIKC